MYPVKQKKYQTEDKSTSLYYNVSVTIQSVLLIEKLLEASIG
jgi:hypothetical protein